MLQFYKTLIKIMKKNKINHWNQHLELLCEGMMTLDTVQEIQSFMISLRPMI